MQRYSCNMLARMRLVAVAVVSGFLLSACSSAWFHDGERGVSAVGLTPGEWAAISRPGASHKLLASLVGEWNVTLTFWRDPRASGESSSGSSKTSWVLGDRFLEERFTGTISGEDYEGLGVLGYDNGRRRFQSVWIDSFNTAVTTASGRYNPEDHSIHFESEVYDPLLSGTKTIYSILQVTSANSYTFTMKDTSPEGESFTSLRMEYTRAR